MEAKAEYKTLFTALQKFQKECPTLLKTATGQVGKQKYKYIPFEVLVAQIRPALTKSGLVFSQPMELGVQKTILSRRS